MVLWDFLSRYLKKNKAAKNVVRKCYSQRYSSEVQLQRQLAAGVGTNDVAVHLRLSALKGESTGCELDR